MSAMASRIISLAIVYSTVYSGADQRKYQSSASLAFVRGIHRWPVNFPHKGPATRKMFPFDDAIRGLSVSYMIYTAIVLIVLLRLNYSALFRLRLRLRQCLFSINTVIIHKRRRDNIKVFIYSYGAHAILIFNIAEYLCMETSTKVSSEPLSSSIYHSHYSLKNSRKTPNSLPWGWGMGCRSWVQILTEVLPLLWLFYAHYRVIHDPDISRAYDISYSHIHEAYMVLSSRFASRARAFIAILLLES